MTDFPDWTGVFIIVECRVAPLTHLIMAADAASFSAIIVEVEAVSHATGLPSIIEMTPEIDRNLQVVREACFTLSDALRRSLRAPAERDAAIAAMAVLIDALRGAKRSPWMAALFD